MPKPFLSPTEYLSQKDKKLGKIISYFGVSVAKIQKREPFDALVRGIISQQLSNSVSRRIEAKIIEIHGKRPFRPDVTLTIENQQLRECGISNSKIKAIKGIANACLRNELTIESFAGLTDEDAMKKLVSYWGIGPWTADIFMMFCLKRLDVFALGDAGLQKAHQLIYPRAKSLDITSQKWQPYRAIAACYLWKFLDYPHSREHILNSK